MQTRESLKSTLETRPHVFYPWHSFWGLRGIVYCLLFFSKSCLVEGNVKKTVPRAAWPSCPCQLIPQIMCLLWTPRTKADSVLIEFNQIASHPQAPDGKALEMIVGRRGVGWITQGNACEVIAQALTCGFQGLWLWMLLLQLKSLLITYFRPFLIL